MVFIALMLKSCAAFPLTPAFFSKRELGHSHPFKCRRKGQGVELRLFSGGFLCSTHLWFLRLITLLWFGVWCNRSWSTEHLELCIHLKKSSLNQLKRLQGQFHLKPKYPKCFYSPSKEIFECTKVQNSVQFNLTKINLRW